MALSNVAYLGDGSNKIFSVTFPYLSKTHVKVYVDSVEVVAFTWLTSSSISITTAPANLATVVLKRVTPTAPIVDFVDGSTLTESLLDTSSLQGLYVVEEGNDTLVSALALDSTDAKYDADNKVIKNVGTPVNNKDAVTKEYVDTTIPASIASATAAAIDAEAAAEAASLSAAAAALFDPSSYLPKAGGSLTGLLNVNDGADIASASTVDLTATTGNTVRITGTTPVTAFNMNAGQQMELVAVGALPLTYHATTMNINGGVSYPCSAGDRLSVYKDGAGVIRVNVTKQDGTAIVGGSKQIQPITASVGASALTVTLNPTSLDFRDSTLTSGAVNSRTVASAISLVVPSGATLGTISAQQSRLIALAIDNAGTVELAIVNLAGGNDLSETGVISTTALSTGSDSANVIYSTTARTNVAYRVVGFVDSTQATTGTWATDPSLKQGYGGQALATMSSFGFGQNYQTVTRTSGVTYYAGAKPRLLLLHWLSGAGTLASNVNGYALPTLNSMASAQGGMVMLSLFIPAYQSYSYTSTVSFTAVEVS